MNGPEKITERWKTDLANCDITLQTVWPIAKSLTKRRGQKASCVMYGPIGPIFYPIDKANIIAGCLETSSERDLCDCDHRRHVEGEVGALLATVNEEIPVKFKPYGVSKEVHSLKLGKACIFDGIPNECVRHLPRGPLMYFTYLFNHCSRLRNIRHLERNQKSEFLRNPAKTQKFSESCVRSAYCPLRESCLRIRADHSTTLQCMRLADHVTLNFNNTVDVRCVLGH
jgi:hypothetical protein